MKTEIKTDVKRLSKICICCKRPIRRNDSKSVRVAILKNGELIYAELGYSGLIVPTSIADQVDSFGMIGGDCWKQLKK